MISRRIGVVRVARSDRGHLSPLITALGDAAVPIDYPARNPDVDLVVIFGDRWEFAQEAAYYLGRCIPIAHLHAGERTEAVIDDAARWAISEMATWRIAANERYEVALATRYPYSSIKVLGAPGLARLPHKAAEQYQPIILVAFHPETRNLGDVRRQAAELRNALLSFPAYSIIITEPGLDTGREPIMEMFGDQLCVFDDRGWLEMLSHASVLVGNSSCGIIETPSIPLPSVNIGDRQKGRLMASSVLQAPHHRDAIADAIQLALKPEWRARNLTGANPYGDRGAAQRIAQFLLEVEISGA